MKTTTRLFAAAFFAVALIVPLSAQGLAMDAEIVYVDGKDLTVLRAGQPLDFDDPIGLPLKEGDQVQTGPKTTAELRLKQRGAVVKLSENTVLSLKNLGQGSTSLDLLYGRVRSKVEKLASKDSFELRTSSVVAGVRGTDFGCDLIAPRAGGPAAAAGSSAAPAAAPGGAPTVRVYCFTGAVEVSLAPPAAGSAGTAAGTQVPATLPLPAPLLVEAGRMVVVDLQALKDAPVPEALSSRALDEDVRRFWAANEFVASAFASPAPAAFDFTAAKVGLKRKNSALAGGLALAAVGAALEISAYLVGDGDAQLAMILGAGGAVASTASLPVFILALSIDPLAPAKRAERKAER
ncbi:MAG: FecR domain-containing protein [Spirochaetaceae bacterium]|nr:FecR domain-containing protein [Spirochaetaceae bacterium]